MKIFTVLCLTIFLISGCAKIQHMDQLLLLKGMSEEKEDTDAFVDEKMQHLKVLIQMIQERRMDRYTSKKAVVTMFGEPVVERTEMLGGKKLDVWLYRHPTEFKNVDKVYLYFDVADVLVNWEYIRADGTKMSMVAPEKEGRDHE